MNSQKPTPGLWVNLKSLFKAGVLLANVLPVFTGFWLASHEMNVSLLSNLGVLLLTIIGSTLVMAGALALNNWYDVDIDALMERTKKRPTVTGHIALRSVLATGIVLSAAGMLILFLISVESAIYAFIGWFTYVILYTMWAKRRYASNTIIGSISGAVTPLIGWTALESGFNLVPMMFFLLLFIWQMPHTYAIAMRKCEEYRAAGVAMLPVVRGFTVTKRHIAAYIACLLPLPLFLMQLGIPFVAIMTLLNLAWLAASIRGFYVKDDLKWAHAMFKYSVYYLSILFILPLIVTIAA